MISAKSFEFLSINHHHNEDSAVTDLDYSDGSESPPDYEEVADVQQQSEMIFNIHTDTLYSKTSSHSSLELSSDPVTKAKILQSTVFCIHREEGCRWAGPLGRLKGHLNTCQKDAVMCARECGAKIARVNMEDHMKFTCMKRRRGEPQRLPLKLRHPHFSSVCSTPAQLPSFAAPP